MNSISSFSFHVHYQAGIKNSGKNKTGTLRYILVHNFNSGWIFHQIK